MKSFFLVLFLLASSFSITAQQPVAEENTLKNQFDEIFKVSGNYKAYKVINKLSFQKLKNNVLDSLNTGKKTLSEKETLLKTKENTIKNLTERINKIQLALDSSIKKESRTSFLGLKLKKTTYNVIFWLLIVALLLGLLFFMYKFSKSNILTKEAKSNLLEVEQEFEQHRKKTLEKEQKLRRKLQDEINKQRNS